MRSFHRWTNKEIQFLEKNYKLWGAKVCAASLGVKERAVYQMWFKLRHPESVRFTNRLYRESRV